MMITKCSSQKTYGKKEGGTSNQEVNDVAVRSVRRGLPPSEQRQKYEATEVGGGQRRRKVLQNTPAEHYRGTRVR